MCPVVACPALDPFPWLWRTVGRLLGVQRRPALALWVRRVLGVWIVFHALAVLLVAIPVPHPLDAVTLSRPTVAREVTRWHERLAQLGVRSSKQEFEDFLVRLSQGWAQGRNEALAPLATYLSRIRVRQAWYMFTAPDHAPERFRLEVSERRLRRGRPPSALRSAQPVFEIGQPIMQPDLMAPGFVHHYRVRRALLVLTWSRRTEDFDRMCAAFAERVGRRSQRARTVRCSLVRQGVEHPSRLGQAEPRRTVRSLVQQVKR